MFRSTVQWLNRRRECVGGLSTVKQELVIFMNGSLLKTLNMMTQNGKKNLESCSLAVVAVLAVSFSAFVFWMTVKKGRNAVRVVKRRKRCEEKTKTRRSFRLK